MRLLRRIVLACVFVALLVGGWQFAARNSAPVTVHYPGGVFGDVQLWVALSACFAAGVALAALVGAFQVARLRLVARRYRKLLSGLEREVHQLRSLTMEPGPTSEPPPELTETRPPVPEALGRGT